MKKYFLALLALGTALAIYPAALNGQQYNFTASGTEPNGQAVNVNAVLTLQSLGGGLYQLTAASGSVLDPSGNTWSITGVAGYIPYDIGADNLVSIPAAFTAPGSSNLFYFDATAPGGLGFTTNDPNNPGSPQYGFAIGPDEGSNDGQYQFADNGVNGTNAWLPGDNTYGWTDVNVTLTAVPDGGTTLVLLGLAVAGLAGLRRKLGV